MKLPTIDPRWRTPTVLALCNSMRETQDFSAMPILADALQEVDCGDEELLAQLRRGGSDYVLDAALVACVLTDDAIPAIEWVEHRAELVGAPGRYYADNESYADDDVLDFARIMDAARVYLEYGWHKSMGNNESYKDYGWDEFWEKYALLTGSPVSDKMAGNFFTCGC
jgi:hypothetical protein